MKAKTERHVYSYLIVHFEHKKNMLMSDYTTIVDGLWDCRRVL